MQACRKIQKLRNEAKNQLGDLAIWDLGTGKIISLVFLCAFAPACPGGYFH